MQEHEKVIQAWFEMWLAQCDTGIENIFTSDAVYTESWGPKYKGCATIKHWFEEWNTRGKVQVWDIKQFFHKDGQTVVEWYFKNKMTSGKVEEFEKLIVNYDSVAFVGDGINDAPVIARADVGVAMGALGSDAAIEACDVVIMNDDPSLLAKAVKISRKALKIVWQNIFFAIGVKLAIMVLVAVGLASMWEAVFADVGVAVLAILNSMRMLRK